MNNKIKIGITGQTGFIGTHLYNILGLQPEKFTRIPFEDEHYLDRKKLESFVKECDVIIHLAAMNRHNDLNVIYSTNIKLVKQVIEACETTASKPHIVFSSSTQEERDNLYGKSKKEGRKLFESWAEKNNASFSGLIIPNVFGPFGHPNYNSVVATFSHQLTHNEKPKIDVDGKMHLIYVHELANFIINHILEGKKGIENIRVPHSKEIYVSELLRILQQFKNDYFSKGLIPNLEDDFIRNLFNTFLTYIDLKEFYPFHLKKNSDKRGSFIEIIKLNSGGQVSFSTTVPSITRGNHYHIRKAERFAVIKGRARIDIRKIGSDDVISFDLHGEEPSFVDMPIWYTHNITNIGNDEMYTIFWISEHYDPKDPDTYYEQV